MIMGENKTQNMKYITDKETLLTFFDESYYNSINYLDYTSRVEKYFNTSNDIVGFFQLKPPHNVLDYGCSVGLLMDGYRRLGINNTYGFDISEWALGEAKKKKLMVSNLLGILNNKHYQLTTALDVFEHMFDDDVITVLSLLDTEYLLVRIPVKLDGEDDFHLEVSRKDASHVNCKTREEWTELFKVNSFQFVDILKTDTIYDSPGVFCGYFKKVV